MQGVMEQCVERYVEVANVPPSKLKAATTPSIENKNLSGPDFEHPEAPATIATKVLMNIWDADRMLKLDLLQPVISLVREASR